MYNDRPRLKVPYEVIDIITEFTSITLLILMWIYVILSFNSLPETIPTHFNAQGIADGYGSRQTIWFLPLLSLVIYVVLFITNKYPHIHNYMVNINEENALKNYRFSTRIVRFSNLFCVALMAYISFTIIQSAKGNVLSLGKWFGPVVIGVSILGVIIIFVYMFQLNKKAG